MEELVRDLLAYTQAASQTQVERRSGSAAIAVAKAIENLRAAVDETRARIRTAICRPFRCRRCTCLSSSRI